MNLRIEVVGINTDGSEQRREVLTIERQELAMETLGMNLREGKALLASVQEFVIAQQAHEYLETRRACPHCGERCVSKEARTAPVKTVFGPVKVPNPRWKRCSCRSDGPKTFRPMKSWLNERTSPEMLYLETKWSSLIPFAKTSDLLKEVLPVEDGVNPESVRHHLQGVA